MLKIKLFAIEILGLMKGNLKIQFEKNGKNLERKLNPDRSYIQRMERFKITWKKFVTY